MFCIVSDYLTRIQDMDDVLRVLKDKFIPVIAQQKGYKGMEVLTKPNTGELVLLKFWDSEENAKAWSESPAHQQIGPMLTPLLIGNRTHNNYVVQTRIVQES